MTRDGCKITVPSKLFQFNIYNFPELFVLAQHKYYFMYNDMQNDVFNLISSESRFRGHCFVRPLSPFVRTAFHTADANYFSIFSRGISSFSDQNCFLSII